MGVATPSVTTKGALGERGGACDDPGAPPNAVKCRRPPTHKRWEGRDDPDMGLMNAVLEAPDRLSLITPRNLTRVGST